MFAYLTLKTCWLTKRCSYVNHSALNDFTDSSDGLNKNQYKEFELFAIFRRTARYFTYTTNFLSYFASFRLALNISITSLLENWFREKFDEPSDK